MRSMKKYFFLFLSAFLLIAIDSRECFAMEDLVASAGTDAGEAVEEAAAKMADELGITGAEDIAKIQDTLANSMKDLPASALENPKVLEDTVGAAKKAMTDSLNAMKESGENMANALDKFSSDADVMSELSGKVQGSVEDSINSLAKSGQISEEQAGKMLNDLKESQSALEDLGGGAKESADATVPKEGNAAAGEKALTAQQDELGKEFDIVDKPDEDVEGKGEDADAKEKTKFEKVKDALKSAGGKALHFIGEQAAMIAFMTAPQMMQQAIEEELNRKAALRTVAEPVKFGNWVLQVVEPCINEENPLQSVPLYVTVPVANVGDQISQATSAAFSNSIAGGTQGFGDVKIMGIAGSDAAQRYNTGDPAYYKYGKFVMSYPSQSYDKIGASLITDPSFSGLVVDLNDGYAIDATGEQISAPPSPSLIPMIANAPQYQQANVESISSACQKTLLNKLQTAGLTATYSTFSGINSGSSASSIANYFDCPTDSVANISAPAAKGAAQVGQSCIVEKALNQYAQAVTFGTFGSVLPMYGWGTTGSGAILNTTNFPHMKAITSSDAVSDGILVTGSTNSASSKNSDDKAAVAQATTGQTFNFAKAGVNYVAQGCWVYLCANTAFAKAVQNGSVLNSATGPYVDYVIFVDDQGVQVPLQVPVETLVDGTTDVKLPSIGINPKAKFMISLISANMPEFQINGNVIGWQQDGTTYGEMSAFTNAVSSAITSLQSFPELYAQFQEHQKALLELLHSGPFKYGSDNLEEATQYNLTDGSGTTQLYVYEGINCFATSGKDAVKDILIALTSTGNATGLPNTSVASFVSLVTDIKYSLANDGSLVANTDAAFHSAPGTWSNGKFTPDMSKKDSLAWLPYIYNAYTGAKPNGAGLTISQSDYDNLTTYVQALRDAWFNNFSDDQLVHGIAVGDLFIKLAPELDVQDAEKNKLFVYTIAPSPSATLINKDWFVAVDNTQPDLDSLDTSMVNVAADASNAKALVSLVTGMVYDMTGAQLFVTSSGDVKTLTGLSDAASTKHGVVLSVTTSDKLEIIGQEVGKYLQTNYADKKGLTDLFDKGFNAAVTSYALMVNRPVPVGSLGGVSLGIYAGDLALGDYIYFSTAGLTDPSSFEPNDLFVTVRQGASKSLVFGELFVDATAAASGETPTQFILSLVSGQVYDKNGAKFAMSISDVSSYATTQSVYWRAYLKDILLNLQAAYKAQKSAEDDEKAALEAQAKLKSVDADVQWTANDVLEMINRLKAVPFLPAPYAMLKQDPTTKQYVKLSPGSLSDASNYMYTFFQVPYGKTATDTTFVGAVYTSKGELVQVIKGNILIAIMHQYGLSGNATELGAPMMQPSLLMDTADKTLKAGSSGSSMIVSSSKNFPGYDGVMIDAAIASGYSLYYSSKMNGYYVLDAVNNQWIGLGAGHQYGLDGQPIPLKQSVAINKKGKKGTVKILLLEENQAGYMQGMMPDLSHDNDFTSWTNDGSGSWKNENGNVPVKDVKVTDQNGNSQTTAYAMTFKVAGKDKKITYTIDNSYEWQSIMYLPLDDNGDVFTDKSSMPVHKSGRIVRKGGVIESVVLGGDLYAANSSGKGDYTLVNMSDATDLKSLAIKVDINTNVPYVVIADGSGSNESHAHKYGYIYNKLSDDAFNSFLINVVAGNPNANATGAVTVCPISFPVGPMITPKGADSSVKVPSSRTYTLYIPGMSNSSGMTKVYANEVKGVPSAIKPKGSTQPSSYEVFSNKLNGRVYKSANGRFFAQVYKNDSNASHAPFFSYFNRNGYVDLQTAALFDSDGNAMGTSLTLTDWLLLLNTLQITVNVDKDGPALYYRGAAAIATQEQQAGATPAASSAKTDVAGSKKTNSKKGSAKSKSNKK